LGNIIRRWRGTLDVPLTKQGMKQAFDLQLKLGRLDMIYHDKLSRCRDTAAILRPEVLTEDEGPRPWNMGSLFEGREINKNSLTLARYYIQNPKGKPPGGEAFCTWFSHWLGWIQALKVGFAAVGVVTHNRNIQYLYARQTGNFLYKVYDCDGPDFCSVHYYDPKRKHIAPWGGSGVPRGIYLIRHGATSWGT
jgi:broad specificity phosphatase PhoE